MRPGIVFIHGMWGNAGVWDCYCSFFEAKGYDCRVPVLRFHKADPAAKPRPELGQVSLLEYVEDLSRELRGQSTKPVVIGHSMGGLLAQMLAERQLASAVVLLSPAPIAGTLLMNPSALRCFKNILKFWGFWRTPMRLTYKDSLYALFPKMDYRELDNHSHWLIEEPGWEGIAAFIHGWLLEKGIKQ